MKALFLDRDGTLIVDVPYLADPARVELLPGVREGFIRARALGYRLFLFTNQSGVGRGYFTLDDALRCNARMVELLDLGPDVFAGSCIAPETPDQPSLYRKPSPRFILEMIAAHGLDPTKCVMVGDRESDVRAGLNAGTRAAGVCTGEYDEATWQRLAIPGVTVHADFGAFAKTLV